MKQELMFPEPDQPSSQAQLRAEGKNLEDHDEGPVCKRKPKITHD